MSFFGLKQGQDLEKPAAHPTKNSQEYPSHRPPPPGHLLTRDLIFERQRHRLSMQTA